MSISYKPLFLELAEREMSKRELMIAAGLCPNTMTKIRQNQPISMATLCAICDVLDIQFSDIVTYIPDKASEEKSK